MGRSKGRSLSRILNDNQRSENIKRHEKAEERRDKMRGILVKRHQSQVTHCEDILENETLNQLQNLEIFLLQQWEAVPTPTAELVVDQLKERVHLLGEREQPLPYRDCAICMEDMLPEEPVIEFPCNSGTKEGEPHVFHQACLLKWLGQGSTCPLCIFRHEDVDNLDDKLQAQSHAHSEELLSRLPPLPPVVLITLIRAAITATSTTHNDNIHLLG